MHPHAGEQALVLACGHLSLSDKHLQFPGLGMRLGKVLEGGPKSPSPRANFRLRPLEQERTRVTPPTQGRRLPNPRPKIQAQQSVVTNPRIPEESLAGWRDRPDCGEGWADSCRSIAHWRLGNVLNTAEGHR